MASALAGLPLHLRGWLLSTAFVGFCADKFELLASRSAPAGRPRGDGSGSAAPAPDRGAGGDPEGGPGGGQDVAGGEPAESAPQSAGGGDAKGPEALEEVTLGVTALRPFLRSVSGVSMTAPELRRFLSIFDADASVGITPTEFSNLMTWAVVRSSKKQLEDAAAAQKRPGH